MKLSHATTGPILTMLLGGLLTVWLVRQAPGYGTDPSELDGRWSAESIAALRAQSQGHLNTWQLYAAYLKGMTRGTSALHLRGTGRSRNFWDSADW